MVTYALQEMDGRQRGILRNSQGQFISRAEWLETARNDIAQHMKKFEHYKKFVGENPDLKVLMDLEKAQIEAKRAEIRLVYHSKEGINARVKAYEETMKNQGMKGKELKAQVEKYRESLKEERHKYFEQLKGKNNAKNISEAGKKSAKPGFFKSIGNFFKSIGRAIKGNKGKAALAAGAVALTAGAIGLANGCENKTQLPPVNPTDSNVVNTTDTTTVAQEDAVEEQVIEEQSVAEQPAEEKPKSANLKPGDIITLPDGNVHIVQEGESPWTIGKKYLIEKNKDIKGYEPNNKELCNMRDELMKLNNLQYDNTRKKKDYYVNIYPNDTIKLPN